MSTMNSQITEVTKAKAKTARKQFVTPVLVKHDDLPVVTAGSIQVVTAINPVHRSRMY